jgi:hypothetical protein
MPDAGPMMGEGTIPPGGDPSSSVRRAARWLFANRRTGGITVAQWPNVPLWIYLGLTLAERAGRPTGTVQTALRVLADVALLLWALDELARGVNPFRRILGSAVLLATVGSVTVWGHWP